MNYLVIYQCLVDHRKQNIPEGYTEKHHIIPRCMNGTNKKDNIVKLTAREHFIAHQLLVKIFPKDHKLIHAAFMMSTYKRYTSKKYAWLKELKSKTPRSEEHKKKISESNIGNFVLKKLKRNCLRVT
jgi:hypothetical protein